MKSGRRSCLERAVRVEETVDEYKILVRKPKWKRPHERPRSQWEGNNKIDIKIILFESKNYMKLAQAGENLLANYYEQHNENFGFINGRKFCD